jgi:hypothetical protein
VRLAGNSGLPPGGFFAQSDPFTCRRFTWTAPHQPELAKCVMGVLGDLDNVERVCVSTIVFGVFLLMAGAQAPQPTPEVHVAPSTAFYS